MGSIRRVGSALVIAIVLAGGLATTLEAKGKGGSGNSAICSYLFAIIDYDYTTPTILVYAYSLADRFGCTR